MVGINKGAIEKPEIRCRLVAQEIGRGEKMGELLVGTPMLLVVKMLLNKVSGSGWV